MIRRGLCAIFALIFSVMLLSCGDDEGATSSLESSEGATSSLESSEGESAVIEFEQISQAKAKEIMDSGVSYFLLDARTQSEYDEGHIEGAVMIPEYEIKSSQDKLPSDKDTLILVYCRSGRRSKIAAQALCELGYTNVKEFGGIITWEYEIVR